MKAVDVALFFLIMGNVVEDDLPNYERCNQNRFLAKTWKNSLLRLDPGEDLLLDWQLAQEMEIADQLLEFWETATQLRHLGGYHRHAIAETFPEMIRLRNTISLLRRGGVSFSLYP